MYTVGQVSKFLGLSADTLKFYEKKNLVSPIKDDENGYRQYNDYDICDVITANFYRQLDIEIKKIQEIRANKSVAEIEGLLEEKKQQIEEEINYKQQLLEKIKTLQQGCHDISDYEGKYAIRKMPALLIRGEISDFLAYDEYDILKKNAAQKKNGITLTDVRRIIYFDEKGVTGTRCVVVEPVKDSESLAEGEIIKHDRCIYTIVKEGRASNKTDVSESAERFLRKIGKEHHYEPLGTVYINVLLTTYDKGLECRYLEIYAPIEN